MRPKPGNIIFTLNFWMTNIYIYIYIYILLSYNISKNWSTKVDVFGVKFRPDTLIFTDPFFLYFRTDGVHIKEVIV
jgi:hypothetical protein